MKHKTTRAHDLDVTKRILENVEFDAADILDWVRENFAPDEVFEDDELEEWAENADYVRPHDDYPEREL